MSSLQTISAVSGGPAATGEPTAGGGTAGEDTAWEATDSPAQPARGTANASSAQVRADRIIVRSGDDGRQAMASRSARTSIRLHATGHEVPAGSFGP
jgi:hypothetical protein